jgi:hypothetical protein
MSLLRWPVIGCARLLGAAANLCEVGRGLAMVAHLRLIGRAAVGKRWDEHTVVVTGKWITKDDFEEEKKRMRRIYKLPPELEQKQAAYEEKRRGLG